MIIGGKRDKKPRKGATRLTPEELARLEELEKIIREMLAITTPPKRRKHAP